MRCVNRFDMAITSIRAASYQHAWTPGAERPLRMSPEERDDVLQRYVERFDAGALETRAETLRDILRERR